MVKIIHNSFIYFIGYNDNDNIRPLYLKLTNDWFYQ